MSSPQTQWDLVRTGDSLLAISAGIILASTSDNVQTLAIIACERFGATLAICPATCEKVEFEIIKAQSRTARVVDFLKSSVGYSKGDCASQLARSLAGIQFIGLAATLTPSMGPFYGGEALALMLKNSALDKTLVPPARHLKDLLMSLEHRCVQLGFTNLVLSWMQILCDSPSISMDERQHWKLSTKIPSPGGLNILVEALRDLSRIGDATSITLKSTTCTPWIAAFVEWCIGTPPNVYHAGGRPLREEPTSKITLIASCATSSPEVGFEMSVYKSLDNIGQLIATEKVIIGGVSQHDWSGMVSIERYGQWLFQKFDFDIGFASRAIVEALPYCLKQVVTLLHLSNLLEFDRSGPVIPLIQRQTENSGRSITDPIIVELFARPFPKDRNIAGILSRILNSPEPLKLSKLADGLLISDLPLMKIYFKDLKETCLCEGCGSPGLTTKFTRCKKSSVLHSLSFIVADILALSLYDFPEALLIHPNTLRSGTERLKAVVFEILSTGKSPTCSGRAVLEAALKLVGHSISDTVSKNRWVMSCYKGQAVYPRLFETNQLEDDGYLTLSWAQGLLRYQDETYEKALAPLATSTVYPNEPSLRNTGVTSSRNLFPGNELTWRITAEDNLLEVILSVVDPIGKFRSLSYSPPQVLASLASALILKACPHSADSKLSQADPFCQYSHFLEPLVGTTIGDTAVRSPMVNVVPVDGNKGLRMISLAGSGLPFRVVLRDKACLSCCLEVARRAGYSLIIC